MVAGDGGRACFGRRPEREACVAAGRSARNSAAVNRPVADHEHSCAGPWSTAPLPPGRCRPQAPPAANEDGRRTGPFRVIRAAASSHGRDAEGHDWRAGDSGPSPSVRCRRFAKLRCTTVSTSLSGGPKPASARGRRAHPRARSEAESVGRGDGEALHPVVVDAPRWRTSRRGGGHACDPVRSGRWWRSRSWRACLGDLPPRGLRGRRSTCSHLLRGWPAGRRRPPPPPRGAPASFRPAFRRCPGRGAAATNRRTPVRRYGRRAGRWTRGVGHTGGWVKEELLDLLGGDVSPPLRMITVPSAGPVIRKRIPRRR